MNKFLIFYFLLLGTPLLAQKSAVNLNQSIASGKSIYEAQCQSCHMENGEGLEDVYPPLAKSDYLMSDKARSIRIILNGASGPMKVNGKNYDSEMQGYPLSDQETADVLNYIRNSFGNKGAMVTAGEVAKVR